MSQNQALLAMNRQQQEVMAQQVGTINRLEAELCASQLVQRAAFDQIYIN